MIFLPQSVLYIPSLTLTVFAAEVTVVVKVIGSSVSAPSFNRTEYNVTVAESTLRYTSLITITAKSGVTGNEITKANKVFYCFGLSVGW